MENTPKIIISENDYQKLSYLLNSFEGDIAELLEDELNRAAVVSETEIPLDVVTMNSRVEFVDLDTGTKKTITLVYPSEANLDQNRISILAPIGSALIGLRVGQTISWPVPNSREKQLKVVSVSN